MRCVDSRDRPRPPPVAPVHIGQSWSTGRSGLITRQMPSALPTCANSVNHRQPPPRVAVGIGQTPSIRTTGAAPADLQVCHQLKPLRSRSTLGHGTGHALPGQAAQRPPGPLPRRLHGGPDQPRVPGRGAGRAGGHSPGEAGTLDRLGITAGRLRRPAVLVRQDPRCPVTRHHQVSGRAPPACGFRACWCRNGTARRLLVPGARRGASSAYRPGAPVWVRIAGPGGTAVGAVPLSPIRPGASVTSV